MILSANLLPVPEHEPGIRPLVCRSTNRPLPAGIVTCWEANSAASVNGIWSSKVVACSSCLLFRQDKAHVFSIHSLLTNTVNATIPVPRLYRCDSPWSVIQKRKAEDEASAELQDPPDTAIPLDSTPPACKKASCPTRRKSPPTAKTPPPVSTYNIRSHNVKEQTIDKVKQECFNHGTYHFPL
jgi:hypothetical protein